MFVWSNNGAGGPHKVLLCIHRNALCMVLAFTTVFCLAIREASAGCICDAAALHDVPPLGVANSFIRKGGKDEAITHLRVDRRMGRTSYCSHDCAWHYPK